MKYEEFKKAQDVINEINRIKVIEQQMGIELEHPETFGIMNISPMNIINTKINGDTVIASFFPYAQRDLSEENYAAIKKECDNFIKNSQAIITNLRKEKEKEFKEL